MTIKQQQDLLDYLGYPLTNDGIDGPKTQAALAAFRADYGQGPEALPGAVAGTVPLLREPEPETVADSWEDIEYFTREEYACTCGRCGGFPAEPYMPAVRLHNAIRAKLGFPCTIIESGGSGVRCPQHNAEVGGAANSEHLYGRAADLHCAYASPDQMAAVAESLMQGQGELGIYSWGIHVAWGGHVGRWDDRK